MINYGALRKLAGMIAANAGLAVEIKESVDTPHTGGRVIRMPLMPEDERSDGFVWWWYAFIHECEHNRGSNKLDLSIVEEKKVDMRSPFGYVLNIIADHNIERKAYGEYGGKDTYLVRGRDLHYNRCDSDDELPPDELNKKLRAVWMFDWLQRKQWCPISFIYHDLGCKYITALLPLADEYRAARDGGLPNLELCRKVWDVLDITDTENKDDTKKDGGGGESREEQAQEMHKNASEEAEAIRKAIEKALDQLPHQHGDPKDGEEMYPSGSDDIVQRGEGAYQPVNTIEVALTSGVEDCQPSHLAHKVATLLRVFAQKKWEGGKQRGKINRRSLWQVNSGGDRVFKQASMKDVLDTTVTLLVDASGSMSGAKWDAAREATAQMASALNKVGIPYEVLAFTQHDQGTQHIYIAKDYTHQASPQEIKGRMQGLRLSQNLDGDALLHAHYRLSGRKQHRKVLIVLSDGQPSGYATGDADAHLKRAAKEIERARRVELYAVGVLTDAPKNYYKNYMLLSDPNEIEATVLSLIKNSIIK